TQARQRRVEFSDVAEKVGASHCGERASRCLTSCGYVRNWTRVRDEESRSCDSDPNPISPEQKGRQSYTEGRPNRPKITASDLSGGLAQFARQNIREKSGRNLDEVCSDFMARNLRPLSSLCHSLGGCKQSGNYLHL